MSLFQLDPESSLARIRGAGSSDSAPTLPGSIARGVLGFTLLSVAGFAPWALGGRFLYKSVGEAGLYAICAVVFIGLSGPLLHRLIIGPGSLARFYKLFAAAFTPYSVGWIGGWMAFGGHTGSVVGLLMGTGLMGWVLASAFGACSQVWKIIAALFLLNAAGYFLGGVVEEHVSSMNAASILGLPVTKSTVGNTARLLWGVCYGVGFGAGLGIAFFVCQERLRAAMSAPSSSGG